MAKRIDNLTPRIDDMLQGGLSDRDIARELGISRMTVGRIRRGERAKQSYDQKYPHGICPGCNKLVRLPCVLCAARAQQRANPCYRITSRRT
jgi:hypothetical protein